MIKVLLQALEVSVPAWFYILQIEMLGLNVTLNPLIYTVTNRRFRNFVFKRVLRFGGAGAKRQGSFHSRWAKYSYTQSLLRKVIFLSTSLKHPYHLQRY